jgi:hypothetical protein
VTRGEPAPSWKWSLALVASVHLLTTAGLWYVTDHGEMLYIADRVLSRGTLDLWDPGEPGPTFFRWPHPEGGGPIRSRFVPVPSLTLVPLLFADRALGLGEPGQFGRLVHLQGHVFVLSGLALLGFSLRRLGASPQAAAVAVVLVGLSWPVWMVARRLGPEPILFFLVAVFLAASIAPSPSARLAQALVCFVLPWTHGTGPVWSAALVLSAALGVRGSLHERAVQIRPLVFGSLLGIGSFVFLWNHLYQGHWLTGGYAAYPESLYVRQSPLVWARTYLSCVAFELPLLLVLALWGARVAGRRDVPGRLAALTLTSAALLFTLGTPFSYLEPSRRLAFLVPAWGLAVGATWDRLRARPAVAQALIGLAGVLGLYWFLRKEGGYYWTSHGVFYLPAILWLRLLNHGRSVAIPVFLLLGLLAVSFARTVTLLRESPQPAGEHEPS